MAAVRRRTFLGVLGSVFAWHLTSLDGASHQGPALIMLIRHGEDIGENSFHLSPQGKKRAEALPRLFGPRLPRPDIIIATRASKGSDRPMETVEPLAMTLHLPIDNRFRDDDYALLARELLTDPRYDGKIVLVCWHHGKLDNLIKALGVKGAPKWPDSQFDHVWMVDFKKSGKARFEDVHQQLLPGDS